MWHCNPIKTLSAAPVLLLLSTTMASAEHPFPQPRPGPSTQILSADGMTTTVITPEGHFPPSDPFADPPGSNHLENVNSNMFDGDGDEMPNTLPSTPDNPYNLHPDPTVSEIDRTSPTDDLEAIFAALKTEKEDHDSGEGHHDGDDDIDDGGHDSKGGKKDHGNKGGKKHRKDQDKEGNGRGGVRLDRDAIQMAIDILQGTTQGKPYDGFPLLHYNGPNKVKTVVPECLEHNPCQEGDTVVGGNVNVHQIWFDSHIESDAGCIDPSATLQVPWTITYTVDTLHRGHEDFAPMVMYFDDPETHPAPDGGPLPHVAMDQTFFPMEEGTRTVFRIGMAPGKYYNLTYHWGWRVHPPRVQVSENCRKQPGGKPIPQWEIDVFGDDPMGSEEARLAAIDMIGDLAPAKRMWRAFRGLKSIATTGHENGQAKKLLAEAERAFFQWKDRTQLPDGVTQDPDSTVTLLFVNNTLYGHMADMPAGQDNQVEFREWTTRGQEFKVHIYNGDYFIHGYTNVDFGGSRGWENQFQSTVDVGGAGPWFTFGRFHWWPNAGGRLAFDGNGQLVSGGIMVPPATRDPQGKGSLTSQHELSQKVTLGEHNVHITYNFEPSRRLRIYQFDPLHHDIAVWSIH